MSLPAPDKTLFAVFALPHRYQLDPALLEARYREESWRWHPDRHGQASPAERARVLQRATDLNEAYRVLRSDQRRAEYLLKLRGVDLVAESGPGRVPPSPGFLMEVMELREALQEAREGRRHEQVEQLAADVRGRVARDRAVVAERFQRLEGLAAGEGEQALVTELAQALIRLRYYERFLAEVAAYEEARELEESV